MVKFQGQRSLESIIEFVEKKVLYPDNTATCDMIYSWMNDSSFKKHIVVYFGGNRELIQQEFDQGVKEDKSNTVWVQNFDHFCADSFNTSYESAIMILPKGYDNRERVLKHDKYYNLWSWVRKNYNTPLFKLEKKYDVPIQVNKWRVAVLMTDGDKSQEQYYKTFEKLAAKQHNFLFAVSDGSNDLHEFAKENMGFKDV